MRSLQQWTGVLLLTAILFPTLTGTAYRVRFLDPLQVEITRKASFEQQEAPSCNEFKKPRYPVLDYPTLLAGVFTVSYLPRIGELRCEPDWKKMDIIVREIFVPPES